MADLYFMKNYLTYYGLLFCVVFLPEHILAQESFSNTSGWIEYHHREAKISLKHPPLWKCYSWSKNNFYIDMNGSVLNNYLDENGRPVWTYLTVTIVDGPLKTIPLFSKLKRSDISSYKSYEYIVKGNRYNSLVTYLDINEKKHIQFTLYRYLPDNPGNIQTGKLVRTVMNSFSID